MREYPDRSRDRLSPEQIEMLDHGRGDRRLDSYFFSFEATGVEPIDRILAAIARAGKAYHSTESWDESADFRSEDGPSHIDLIQSAANSAADAYPKVTTDTNRTGRTT